jgi:hypothetical protein
MPGVGHGVDAGCTTTTQRYPMSTVSHDTSKSLDGDMPSGVRRDPGASSDRQYLMRHRPVLDA